MRKEYLYLFTGLGNIPRNLVPDGTNYKHGTRSRASETF